ncbi:hypothetical protein KIN20_035253 [Parelaphostrongylus tenuis]|uniref:PiggyBac transposable element-derived protein domain-containing protein n=1 Tax=Parelaphostrongylus tenuis TaxID=148309 RepID=A0AAD5RBG9_PARTN|nr:hypothetical protein KIN20_035253 [Parelaphostrongylus tenuis]
MDPRWKKTNIEKMKRFLALCMQMSIAKFPHIQDYWSTHPHFNKLLFGASFYVQGQISSAYEELPFRQQCKEGALLRPFCTKVLAQLTLRLHVLQSLVDELLNKGIHLCTDSWYTSVSLAERLSQKNTYLTGTCRKSRQGLPREFMKTRSLSSPYRIKTVCKEHQAKETLEISQFCVDDAREETNIAQVLISTK